MANEVITADHMRTTASDLRVAAGCRIYGAHVVSFIGEAKPWEMYGSVAIQNFRIDEPCVYFIGSTHGAVKIGHSICPLERLAAFQMGSPLPLRILAMTEGGAEKEREYHQRFADWRSHGEWFDRVPELVAEMKRINPHFEFLHEWRDDDV